MFRSPAELRATLFRELDRESTSPCTTWRTSKAPVLDDRGRMNNRQLWAHTLRQLERLTRGGARGAR